MKNWNRNARPEALNVSLAVFIIISSGGDKAGLPG
jgi:hypothetical protein